MTLFGKKKPFFAKCRELIPEVLAAYERKKSEAVDRKSAVGSRVPAESDSRLTPQSSRNRIAILGDVHANLEALEAVLKDAQAQGVSRFACTGDLVGYGANPSECLEIVKGLCCPVVKGNHDEYAATDSSLNEFTLPAMNALIWTREHLSPEERTWLNALSLQADLLATKNTKNHENNQAGEALRSPRLCEGLIHLVHSCVVEPERWHYIIKSEEAEKVLPQQKPDLVFFGHTHIPSLYAYEPQSGAFEARVPLAEETVALKPGWKYLINPGSVGQPRDRDPRASYAVYNPQKYTIEIRRINYDVKMAAQKIIDAGLPIRNAERLSAGK